MNRLHLRFVPRAVEQLEQADQWWRENRSAAPDLVVTELADAVELLRNSPGAGACYPNESLPDVRRFLLRRTRFHVYYVVRNDTLVIAAVWSGLRGHGPPLTLPGS